MTRRGQVKWFDPKKGYGFIIGPDGQDVFVHYSHIDQDGFRLLKDGETVDYELVESEKGWQARSVQRIEVGIDRGAVNRMTGVSSQEDGEVAAAGWGEEEEEEEEEPSQRRDDGWT